MKLLRKLRNWLRSFKACDHTETVYRDDGTIFSRENVCEVGGHFPLGDWGEPEPHPIPHFANRVKIQRRPFAAVMHCKKCGFVGAVRGHDQRDIPQDQGGTLPVIKSRITERTSPHARNA